MMRRGTRWMAKMATALGLLLAPGMALAEEGEAPTPPPNIEPVLSLGDRAPAFFLNAVNAEVIGARRVVLEDFFRDEETKAVVISFFATWCPPCKKELPLLQSLYERYGDQGLRVVVVSIDREPEAVATLSEFIGELGVRYPVVSDRFNFLARRYLGTTTALPSVFITDGDGVLQTIKQGYGDDAEAFFEGEVRRVIGLGPVAEAGEDAADGEDGS
jgi:thiol-disulfide isomerase/thioredoxin